MTSFRLGLRFGKWTLIPLGLTLALSALQLILDRSSETNGFTNLDRFILTNSAGLLLTLLLEVLKRWSAEERIIKLTNYLDTGSAVFQSVVNLIEDIDDVVRRLKPLKDIWGDEHSHPVMHQLQASIARQTETLSHLKNLKIQTDYTNSSLTNRLTEVADRILAVSDPVTDLLFWSSPEGLSSWEAQLDSNALKNSEESTRADVLPRYGICRVFVLPREVVQSEIGSFLDAMVEQVSGGVIASVLMRGQHRHFEGAIFGDLAYRVTEMIGVTGDKQNVYDFDPANISKKIQEFQVLWNSAWRLNPNSRGNFTENDLKNFLHTKGFRVS